MNQGIIHLHQNSFNLLPTFELSDTYSSSPNLASYVTRSLTPYRFSLRQTLANQSTSFRRGGGNSSCRAAGPRRQQRNLDECLKISGHPLYLDMQVTSPVDPRVLNAMLPFYISIYGNPHSRTHFYGWESENAVEDACAKVAAIIGASPKEIVFTSGALEFDEFAGVCHRFHLAVSQTRNPA